MKQAEKPESRGTDKVLLVIVFLLVIIGLIILYSTSSYNGQIKFGDPFLLFEKTDLRYIPWIGRDVCGRQNRLSYLGKAGGAGVSDGNCTLHCRHVVRR